MSLLQQLDIDHQELIELYRKALLEGHPITQLEETVAKKIQRLHVTQKKEKEKDEDQAQQLKKSVPLAVRIGSFLLPFGFIMVGLALLGSAVIPVIGFYAKNITQHKVVQLTSPIPKDKILDVTPLVVAQATGDPEAMGEKIEQAAAGPLIVDAELDYTNLSNWFDDSSLESLQNRTTKLTEQTGQYILEIPELEVYNAVVKIGGTNLDESLIQYPGTSLPGKPGSPVVFGHSVLRSFYNPKESNPRRYNSIFSYIMTLEKGDKFYVKYGDVKYTYMVQSKKEVKPSDTYILNQDYTQRQFKIVTCVPEGTYLRRGVVTAQLVNE